MTTHHSAVSSQHERVGRLPLPIALVLNRAELTPELKLRHDLALTAWEMAVRLAVAIAPPADTSRIADNASLGTWREALFRREFSAQHRAFDEVRTLFSRAAGGKSPRQGESVTFVQLTEYLAGYRNRIHGHSAPRSDGYYASAASVLIRALLECFDQHLLADPGWELLASGQVQLDERGQSIARLIRLSGAVPTLAHARAPVPPHVRPNQLYWQRGGDFLALAPWMRWQRADDGGGRVLFFNGSPKRPLYLHAESGLDVRESEIDTVLVAATLAHLPLFAAELPFARTELGSRPALPPPSPWPAASTPASFSFGRTELGAGPLPLPIQAADAPRVTWPAPPPPSSAHLRRQRRPLVALAAAVIGALLLGGTSVYACQSTAKSPSLVPDRRVTPVNGPPSSGAAPEPPKTAEERERLFAEALALQTKGKQLDALLSMTAALKLARERPMSSAADERRIHDAYQVLLSERCPRTKPGWVKMLVAHAGSSRALLRSAPSYVTDPEAVSVDFGTCVLVDPMRIEATNTIGGKYLFTDKGDKVGWMHEDLLEPRKLRTPLRDKRCIKACQDGARSLVSRPCHGAYSCRFFEPASGRLRSRNQHPRDRVPHAEHLPVLARAAAHLRGTDARKVARSLPCCGDQAPL